jgi:hypothetical protein
VQLNQALWDEEAKIRDEETPPPQEPAPEPVPETPPEEEPAPEVDPLIERLTKLEQSNAQLLQHVKTAEGRVSAMQRELELSRQAQKAVSDAPSQQQIAVAAKNPEKWESLKTDFPEWGEAMEEFVTAKLSGFSAPPAVDVDALVAQKLGEAKTETVRLLEESRIEMKYEDWRDIVNTTDFTAWYSAQPPEIQRLAESTKARDAIEMLDKFHAAKAKPAAGIRQEREQRLAAAVTTRPGQTPPPKTLGDLSVQELWNHEAAMREKTRSERGF